MIGLAPRTFIQFSEVNHLLWAAINFAGDNYLTIPCELRIYFNALYHPY